MILVIHYHPPNNFLLSLRNTHLDFLDTSRLHSTLRSSLLLALKQSSALITLSLRFLYYRPTLDDMLLSLRFILSLSTILYSRLLLYDLPYSLPTHPTSRTTLRYFMRSYFSIYILKISALYNTFFARHSPTLPSIRPRPLLSTLTPSPALHYSVYSPRLDSHSLRQRHAYRTTIPTPQLLLRPSPTTLPRPLLPRSHSRPPSTATIPTISSS